MARSQENQSSVTSTLFWRISAIFLGITLLLAGVYVYLTYSSSKMYFLETTQRLNWDLATWIADHSEPFKDGVGSEEEQDKLFSKVMVANPRVEVYLLDPAGDIVNYFAPNAKIKLENVPLEPIRNFIDSPESKYIEGEDPRDPGNCKVFSAAEVVTDGELKGYIYVILAGEEYASAMDQIRASYYLTLAGRSMGIALFAAVILGLLIIWLLTRNLNTIVRAVRRFRQGDLQARAELDSKGELSLLAGDFNEMADTIVRNIDEIKSVERLRRELIANVSHDLRTPLASIQGYAETLLMKQDELPEADRIKYTETILKSTQRIKKLVDDLFELSKLESSQTTAQFEFFSIAELLYDSAQKYELLTRSRSLKFKTEIPENIPMIYGDIALMDRVLQNLLDNAIRHTPEGGEVLVGMQQKEDRIEVWIQDTGVGISEEELPHIFDRYRKAQNSRKDGTGLGLAIVKKILELHQSPISVNSKLNQGTTFTFLLSTQEFQPA